MSFCPSCGAGNADGARFCEKCGKPIAEATETPAAPVAEQAEQVVEQAGKVIADVTKNAGKAVGGLSTPMLIMAAVGVVVLLVAYLIFLKPMSIADYEDGADEYTVQLMDATSDMENALYEFESGDLGDYDSKIDSADFDDLMTTYQESKSEAKDAAKKIRGLRPPKEYKTADSRLLEWADYYSGDYWKTVSELVDSAEGRTYGRFADDVMDFWGDISRDSSRANRALSRAASDLGLNWYGE